MAKFSAEVRYLVWEDKFDAIYLTSIGRSESQKSAETSGQYHDTSLVQAEEEIRAHYIAFARFCNEECLTDPSAGKQYYDLADSMYFDLMGNVPRSGFPAHYDKITPYLSDAQIAFKDLEIVAVTDSFGYATGVQRYWGKAADGNDFDFQFRTTSLLRKVDGHWKYVHEHFSFPVDLSTQKASLSSELQPEDAMRLDGKQ